MGQKLTKGVFNLVTDTREPQPQADPLDFLQRPPTEAWTVRQKLDKSKALAEVMGRPQNVVVTRIFLIFAVAVAVLPLATFYVALHVVVPQITGLDPETGAVPATATVLGLDKFAFAGAAAVIVAIGLQALYVLASFVIDRAVDARRDAAEAVNKVK